jgi:hypothetical protein
LLVLVAPCRCALSSKSAIICIVFFLIYTQFHLVLYQ